MMLAAEGSIVRPDGLVFPEVEVVGVVAIVGVGAVVAVGVGTVVGVDRDVTFEGVDTLGWSKAMLPATMMRAPASARQMNTVRLKRRRLLTTREDACGPKVGERWMVASSDCRPLPPGPGS